MNDVDSEIEKEQFVWAAPDSLEFYTTHRQTVDDLYPSERFFLPEAARTARTCLDIGCAAGGFSRIMKSLNPGLEYTGVDVVPEFVARAQEMCPESRFEVGDGVHFTTPPNTYDLVFSSGILHLNSRSRDIVRAGYAQARRTLLCDFRMSWGPTLVGTFRVAFDPAAGGDGRPRELPYIVLNVDEVVTELRALEPPPQAITIRGYYHPPAAAADVPLARVLMAFVRIDKGEAITVPQVVIDLPRDDS